MVLCTGSSGWCVMRLVRHACMLSAGVYLLGLEPSVQTGCSVSSGRRCSSSWDRGPYGNLPRVPFFPQGLGLSHAHRVLSCCVTVLFHVVKQAHGWSGNRAVTADDEFSITRSCLDFVSPSWATVRYAWVCCGSAGVPLASDGSEKGVDCCFQAHDVS